MKNVFIFIFVPILFISVQHSANAQFGGLGKKLKQAAEKAVEKEIFGEEEVPDTPDVPGSKPENNNPSSVKGKKLTPPDINLLINDANSAYNNDKYSDARYHVKEAIKGVELEIGYKILEEMPTSAAGLNYQKENDGVVSYGLGFAGLIITRTFEGSGQNVSATVGNNSALSASYGYLINSGYAANDGNSKPVSIQGYRGNMQFDGNNTYTVALPFAQSSVFVLECSGFSDENEVESAVADFDIQAFEDLLADSGSESNNEGDAGAYIASADSKYGNADLEGARFELQRSLVELDLLIGKKVLEMLPSSLDGLDANPEADDYIANSGGFAGVFVERAWGNTTDNQIQFSLMDDSPMMAMVSQFINNPMMMGMSGKKSVKIDGYKGMIEVNDDSESGEITINIPNNQSMLTLSFYGKSENDALQLANQIPVGDIFALIR